MIKPINEKELTRYTKTSINIDGVVPFEESGFHVRSPMEASPFRWVGNSEKFVRSISSVDNKAKDVIEDYCQTVLGASEKNFIWFVTKKKISDFGDVWTIPIADQDYLGHIHPCFLIISRRDANELWGGISNRPVENSAFLEAENLLSMFSQWKNDTILNVGVMPAEKQPSNPNFPNVFYHLDTVVDTARNKNMAVIHASNSIASHLKRFDAQTLTVNIVSSYPSDSTIDHVRERLIVAAQDTYGVSMVTCPAKTESIEHAQLDLSIIAEAEYRASRECEFGRDSNGHKIADICISLDLMPSFSELVNRNQKILKNTFDSIETLLMSDEFKTDADVNAWDFIDIAIENKDYIKWPDILLEAFVKTLASSDEGLRVLNVKRQTAVSDADHETMVKEVLLGDENKDALHFDVAKAFLPQFTSAQAFGVSMAQAIRKSKPKIGSRTLEDTNLPLGTVTIDFTDPDKMIAFYIKNRTILNSLCATLLEKEGNGKLLDFLYNRSTGSGWTRQQVSDALYAEVPDNTTIVIKNRSVTENPTAWVATGVIGSCASYVQKVYGEILDAQL